MKAAKILSTLLALFITMPIWYYLQYKILEAINASELLWFLFWVYLPVGMLVQIINKVVGAVDKKESDL